MKFNMDFKKFFGKCREQCDKLVEATKSRLEKIDKSFDKDAFMKDSNVSSLSKPSRIAHWLLISCGVFIVVFIAWAYFAKLDEVTSGVGKVIPSRQVQVVQNLEGGIVRKIFVKEGEDVKKGQELLQIDDISFASQFRENSLKVAALTAKVARLEAEADGKSLVIPAKLKQEFPDLVQNEEQLYELRKKELQTKGETLRKKEKQLEHDLTAMKAKKDRLGRSLALVQRELGMTKPLLKSGAVSAVEVLRLERQVNDLAGEMKTAELGIPRLQEQLAEVKSKIAELTVTFRAEALNELSKTEAELKGKQQVSKALQDRVVRTMVRSPVAGTVKQINIATVGGVIKPGMDLMEIVPSEDTLLIEARIKPADVAFLRPGQKAIVKFTAYDYSIYGGLPGTLVHISADTIKDDEGKSFYEIRVRTDRAHLGPRKETLPIIPGMTAEVDILTGEKSVLDYILKPILKTQQKALRER